MPFPSSEKGPRRVGKTGIHGIHVRHVKNTRNHNRMNSFHFRDVFHLAFSLQLVVSCYRSQRSNSRRDIPK